MHFPISWIERIPLLWVHFSHVIAKQGTIFKDICFQEGIQFCSACSFIDLTYHGPANWSFRRQIPSMTYFVIIFIYYEEVLLYFFYEATFPKNYICFFFVCLFAFWCKKIRWHIVKGVLLYVLFRKV